MFVLLIHKISANIFFSVHVAVLGRSGLPWRRLLSVAVIIGNGRILSCHGGDHGRRGVRFIQLKSYLDNYAYLPYIDSCKINFKHASSTIQVRSIFSQVSLLFTQLYTIIFYC